jgi:hypothetical protein
MGVGGGRREEDEHKSQEKRIALLYVCTPEVAEEGAIWTSGALKRMTGEGVMGDSLLAIILFLEGTGAHSLCSSWRWLTRGTWVVLMLGTPARPHQSTWTAAWVSSLPMLNPTPARV